MKTSRPDGSGAGPAQLHSARKNSGVRRAERYRCIEVTARGRIISSHLIGAAGNPSDESSSVSSPLLRQALCRRVGRGDHPWVAALLPHRDRRRREGRVGEGADGDGDVAGKAFARPIHGGAARRTEAESQRIAACGLDLGFGFCFCGDFSYYERRAASAKSAVGG
jgi:hypothetical protein